MSAAMATAPPAVVQHRRRQTTLAGLIAEIEAETIAISEMNR